MENNQYQENDEFVERSFLILLIVITVTQFAVWGQQSVRFILTTIFPVEDTVLSTPLEILIGFGAMIASGLVFAGSVMWWKRMSNAFSFITIGSGIFMFKNILDIFNETWIFSNATAGQSITMSQIDNLALSLGNQFFQLAFWVFIFFYFRHKIVKHVMRTEQPTMDMPPQQPETQFTPQNPHQM